MNRQEIRKAIAEDYHSKKDDDQVIDWIADLVMALIELEDQALSDKERGEAKACPISQQQQAGNNRLLRKV